MTVTARKCKSDSDDQEVTIIEVDGEPGEVESEDKPDATSLAGASDDIDMAKALHDEYVIKNTMVSALEYAHSELGLDISETVQTAAQGIITTASKLAKKVHESPQLKHELGVVATRWNSDYDCLQSLINLRICIEMLIEDSANNLDTF
ncbi:hypothetical protein RSAG8_13146, partial [Rhizoctonia solani AG-8 WAC10335]